MASRCSSGLLSRWQLVRGVTVGQEQKTVSAYISTRPDLMKGAHVLTRGGLDQASFDTALERANLLFYVIVF